jgi:hypothetical protein
LQSLLLTDLIEIERLSLDFADEVAKKRDFRNCFFLFFRFKKIEKENFGRNLATAVLPKNSVLSGCHFEKADILQ